MRAKRKVLLSFCSNLKGGILYLHHLFSILGIGWRAKEQWNSLIQSFHRIIAKYSSQLMKHLFLFFSATLFLPLNPLDILTQNLWVSRNFSGIFVYNPWVQAKILLETLHMMLQPCLIYFSWAFFFLLDRCSVLPNFPVCPFSSYWTPFSTICHVSCHLLQS